MRTISNGSVTRAHLFDIQTVEGDLYFLADRLLRQVQPAISSSGPHALISGLPPVDPLVDYQPWILTPPTFTFHRSMVTDTGSFTVQNVSGDTLARDFEKIMRRSAMEGALFVYRYWNAAAEVADVEVHGTLTVDDVSPTSVTFSTAQLLNAAADDAPAGIYSEICQLVWGEKRCGATGSTECLYSYKTCQVPERFTGILNDFEKNYGEAVPVVPTQPINRRRTI